MNRKKARQIHKKISDGKIGRKYTMNTREEYIRQTKDTNDPLCGYAREPRIITNSKGKVKTIYCLCQYSPLGGDGGDGVCISDFPMPYRCEYGERGLLDNRRGLMDQIDGVRFTIGTPTTGMSGHVKWGREHLKVDVYLGSQRGIIFVRLLFMGLFDFLLMKRVDLLRWCRLFLLGNEKML